METKDGVLACDDCGIEDMMVKTEGGKTLCKLCRKAGEPLKLGTTMKVMKIDPKKGEVEPPPMIVVKHDESMKVGDQLDEARKELTRVCIKLWRGPKKVSLNALKMALVTTAGTIEDSLRKDVEG